LQKNYISTPMNAIAIERETNNYWNLLKHISKEVKVALISRLSASLIVEDDAEDSVDASQFSGIWSDEEYVDSEQIAQLVKSSRNFSRDINRLWP